jgi:hypothetical protein
MSAVKSAPAELGQRSAEHHPDGSAGGCPACNSESRSHELVVIDEHGECHIRSVHDR